MKKYIIFDLDWTLINSNNNIKEIIFDYFKINDIENYDKVRYTLDFDKISSIKELLEYVYSGNEENIDKKHDEIYKYLDEKNHKSKFIDWTIKKIIELKDTINEAKANLKAIKDSNMTTYTEFDFFTAQKKQLLEDIKAQNLNIDTKSAQIDPIIHSIVKVLMDRIKLMD